MHTRKAQYARGLKKALWTLSFPIYSGLYSIVQSAAEPSNSLDGGRFKRSRVLGGPGSVHLTAQLAAHLTLPNGYCGPSSSRPGFANYPCGPSGFGRSVHTMNSTTFKIVQRGSAWDTKVANKVRQSSSLLLDPASPVRGTALLVLSDSIYPYDDYS